MKTVRQKMIDMLVEHGMFESQANQVLDEKTVSEISEAVSTEDYKMRFDSPADYPEIIYNLMFCKLKPIVLNWVEKNIPNAWYKPMFQ